MIVARRVVFDSSTLVSAAILATSAPRRALLKALSSCVLCASLDTLAELEEVLDRSKFDRYLSKELRRDFVGHIRKGVLIFVVPDTDIVPVLPTCRDSKDNKFLALALAAEAEAIVSSDKDLLVLHPWNGIAILRPAEFLSEAPSP